jgi:hypothetical protein
MIDIGAIRERLAALQDLEACASRCAELGLIRDSSQTPYSAPGRAAPAARPIVRAEAPSPATRSPAGSGRVLSCARCSKQFRPRPKAGPRAKFCGPKCQQRAAHDRRRARAAEADLEQARAVIEQAERDGFPSTLSWSSNGDATSTQID